MPRFESQINIVVPSGTAPLLVNQSTLVANLNADLLDGQHGSYFEGRDTTAIGFSGGSLTLTRTAGNLSVSLDGRYLPLTGGVLTGALTGTTAAFGGDVAMNAKVSFGNRRSIFTISHGGAQDLAWKKVADITMPTGLYQAVTFKVDVLDNGGNFGWNSACLPMTYFVSCRRSGGVQDDYNDAVIYGPVANYVRVVKTATGVYELQIRQIVDWSTHLFTVEATVGSASVTYATGTLSNGSTTGTIYTATAGWTQNLAQLSVSGATTFGGIATFSGASGTYINTGGGNDAFGYNATSGLGHYIRGTGTTYIYGGGAFFDGSTTRTLLHAGNYNSYALPLTGGTITGQLSVNGSTASDILRLYTTGSTVWKLGVTDASGSFFNITADFGNFTINKSNGNVTTPGAFVSTVATGTAPLSVTSTTVVGNLNSDLLDGQHGSYFENRDTTAVGFSGGTLTLTRAAGNLTASLDGRYLPLAGGAMTGSSTISGDNHMTFGPNSSWGSSIRIGGNGYTATGTEMASVVTTDGNLHLDAAKSANGIYLNWYGGTTGVFFGNGASGQVGRVDGSGNASFSGAVTSTYGSFGTPGIIVGDAQYGFYTSSGHLFYKSASTGNHIWRNIANSADTMTLDNSGNLLLSGSLRLTDTTTGISKSGGRLSIRSESTDDVANFASYGLYLPKSGQTAGLYVESAIEARAGIRLGTSAANGTITVGADTANTANRLVQRDGSGNIAVSGIKQGADLARPLASWGVSGTSTGMVIFSFPGGSGNYGMVHCVFDIYEYNSNTVSTVIVGGHNWNGQWYNTGSNVIGRCGKTVRLGFKDGKYCVVFGGAASSWEYGTIVLRKIHNGAFYTGIMDMGGAFTTSQTATESFTWVTGDLRVLRSSAAIISDDALRGTEVYSSNWFRNDNSGSGIYNSATANHFYSDGPYWNVAYSGTQGIRFRNGHNGTILGYIYAETDGNFGLLSNNGGWAVQVKPGGGGNLNGTWTINSNTPLTSANYSGYALPLTGGTLTGALNGTTASFSGNVKGGRVTLRDDCLEQHVDDSDGVGIFVNYFGYASGTTRFRNFGVFNGKNQQLFYITGSTGATAITGTLSVTGAITQGGNQVLHAGNYSSYSLFSGQVSSGGNNGFANATWSANVRNPIWYFGNATTYGISYFQGSAGIGSADTIGIHPNGTATAAGSAFAVTPTASYVNNNVVLHAGNVGSYALPIGGGTLTGNVTAPRFISNVATGTAPFGVTSTTVVTNLNADLLDGQDGSFYQNAGNLNAGTLLAARLPAFTGGDVTSSAGSAALTLVNSGVSAGTYRSVTVDAKGRVTAGTNPTTLGGYGITDAMYQVDPNGFTQGDINGSGNMQRLWGTDSVQNLIAFRPPTTVEYTTDNVNWIATTISNDVFDGKVFGKWGGFNMNVGSNIGAWTKVRMTWVNFGYHFFSHFTLCHSTNGHSMNFVFYKSDLNGVFSSEAYRVNGISSWPGYTFTSHVNVSGWWDTRDVRMVFELNGNNGPSGYPNNAISIGHIGIMGGYSSFNRVYDWDGSRNITLYGNLTLPGNVTAPRFISNVATGTAPLDVTSTTLVTNLNAQYLNGQLGSYYENRDTTAVGFSGGTLTLTRAAGNLTASLDGRYLPLTGGALSGTISIDTSGSTGSTSTVIIKRSGQSAINFGSYGGAWRSALQIQSNGNDRMLFFVPPETGYDQGIFRVVNGGLSIDVGGTTSTTGVQAISINSAGSVAIPVGLSVTATVNALNFSGPGTGLTGTATGLTAGAVPWTGVTGKPTTLSGYGITDALPLSGGTVNGNLTINGTLLVAPGTIAVNSLTDGYIGFGDPTHTVGWGVSQGVAGRTGDAIWAFGSNGSTGNTDTWYFGIGSASGGTFATSFRITQNGKVTFNSGLDVAGGALTALGNQVLHAGNYSSVIGYTPAYGTAAYQTKSLDTVSTPGLYQYDGGFGGTKPPDNSPNYRTIEIGSGNRFSQIAMPWNSDGFYFRRQEGSTFSAWRTVIHDGNFPSLNTYGTSIGNTLPDRVFMSNDANIKYAPRDTAKAHLGLTGKYGNSRPNFSSDSNYWTGVMGWGTTDWNSIFDWGAGFTDSWSGPANNPGDTSHHVGVQAVHYTNGSSRYGWQMVNGAGTNRWWLRDVWGGSFSSWREILHSANYMSYALPLSGGTLTGPVTSNSKFETTGSMIASVFTGAGTNLTGTAASLTAGAATLAAKASTLSQGGGNGSGMTFNWAGQGGQPSWLWGSNDGVNIYVWNPSNFSVASAAACSGSAAQLNGQAASYYENRDTTSVSISAGTLTLGRGAGNLTTTLGGRTVAWCEFNGNFASSQSPNASFNVSSITKNATGDYTVNFSSAIGNANYVVAGTAQLDSVGQSNYNVFLAVPRRSGAQASGSCRVVCEYPAGVALYDCVSVRVAFIAA